MNRKSLRIVTLLTALFAAGLGTTALHASEAGPHGNFAAGPGFMGGAGGFLGLEKIHASLQLTAAQEALWQTALSTGQSVGGQMKTLHQTEKTDVQTELAKNPPDLAALATRMDGYRSQASGLHDQVRSAWLAVYAALTPAQQTSVGQFLLQRSQHRHR
jgi:Spy/CpxP family protein refolding chaperone